MELYLKPNVNPRNKRFLPGNIPFNKGKKWDEYMPLESRKNCFKGLEIGWKRGRKDIGGLNRKTTLMMKDGKIIGVFPSARQAGMKTGIQDRNIRYVCQGKRKNAGGFQWCYEVNLKP